MPRNRRERGANHATVRACRWKLERSRSVPSTRRMLARAPVASVALPFTATDTALHLGCVTFTITGLDWNCVRRDSGRMSRSITSCHAEKSYDGSGRGERNRDEWLATVMSASAMCNRLRG